VQSGAHHRHDHQPAQIRESFLYRNPVNRELLALAARHRVDAAD
jgi:hypothetical protein